MIGDPQLSVIAFTSTTLNIYSIADLLSKRDYHLNVLQFPPAIHIACTMLTAPMAETFVSDLEEIVQELELNPSAASGEAAAIYGTAATVPDRTIIGDVISGFLDGLTLAK